MSKKLIEQAKADTQRLKTDGTYKTERVITTAQGVEIKTTADKTVLNFCSNNYLGLANNPQVIEASKKAMDKWGYGLSSARFICGTQTSHKKLESVLSTFLGTEDTIIYVSCFDANGGLFEPFFTEQDSIISDELNHASIIDGIRLTKAQRWRYKHSDMHDLKACLTNAERSRYKIIVTDGVFSMDGDIAKLGEICDLADKYDALVAVDDSHATGYIGKHGRGSAEYHNVMGRVDIITTTFGKALGGANGGCISGRRELIGFLRQKSRPYLFSNTLSPAIVGGTLKALSMLSKTNKLPIKTMKNSDYFRNKMIKLGFNIPIGNSAIVPIMIHDEVQTVKMADMLLGLGIYVIGFTYPVVPKKMARVRVQLSALHTRAHLNSAITAFEQVGKELGVI